MIIDSHAHYAHPRFHAEFPYLCVRDGAFAVDRSNRDQLLEEMDRNRIVGVIEPSIGFDAIEKQNELVLANRGRMWAAIGVHPTRCVRTAWKNRTRLAAYAETVGAVAIGETGLDYHYPRKEQYRLRQKRWFVYQIKLADRLQKPLILHIRAADRDAIRILKRYRRRLHGGAVHCFVGDRGLAQEYLRLGFSIGIGGKLFDSDAAGEALRDAVAHIPLDRLLVETDAPFVLPPLEDGLCSGNQRKRLCNASLILPAVIQRIAELRREDARTVEDAIYQNTVRVFGLDMEGERHE